MSLVSNSDQNGSRVKIVVRGRFDFSVHREFRETYRNNNEMGTEFRVNLAGADYMDSSALGMLLLLREHATKNQGQVIIEAPSAEIKKILVIANFNRLFAIED